MILTGLLSALAASVLLILLLNSLDMTLVRIPAGEFLMEVQSWLASPAKGAEK